MFDNFKKRLRRRIVGVPKASIRRELMEMDRAPVTFLQVGAHDGQSGDLLHPFIVNSNWRGILVEPVPYLYDRLTANYASFGDRLVFENAAVNETSGFKTFYSVVQSGRQDVVEWHTQLGSFDRRTILRHRRKIPGLERLIRPISVRTETVRGLLEKHGLTSVDVLAIDTEGYDAVIVRNALSGGIRPRMIIFEHKHLGILQYKTLVKDLRALGYQVFQERANAFAIRRVGNGQPIPAGD